MKTHWKQKIVISDITKSITSKHEPVKGTSFKNKGTLRNCVKCQKNKSTITQSIPKKRKFRVQVKWKWKRKLTFDKEQSNMKTSNNQINIEKVKAIAYKRRGRVCILTEAFERKNLKLCEKCSVQKKTIINKVFADLSNEYEDMSGKQHYISNNGIEDSSEYIYADFLSSSKAE